MPWDRSRRVFLRGAGLAALGVGFHPSSLLVRTAAAAAAGTKVLVKVFLRGGADGLNLCVPYADPDYYGHRGDIALPRPGQGRGVLNLDGYFGLNPDLAPLKPIYDDGRLAFLHAVGHYELTRSHFDAQDWMETGVPGNRPILNSGWLDRCIGQIPGSEVTQAVCFARRLPRSFLGLEPIVVAQDLASFDIRARNWRPEAERLLRAMYEAEPETPVGRLGLQTFEALDILLRTPAIAAPPANGAVYPNNEFSNSMRQAAAIIKAGIGTRCLYVDYSAAFDTHANQLTSNAIDYGNLGLVLAAFDADLGRLRDDVVVMVTTEFGRAAFVNGSQGTDHGSAHCMILIGGGVRGVRVHGRWPGLSKPDLYQERDLAVTTDFRDAFAEVARAQLGVDPSVLFPGYTPGPGPGVV